MTRTRTRFCCFVTEGCQRDIVTSRERARRTRSRGESRSTDRSNDRRARNFGTFAKKKKANNDENNGTLRVAIFSQKSRDIARERTGEQSPKTASGKNRAFKAKSNRKSQRRSMKGRGTHPCTWRGRPPRARGCAGRRARARANLRGVSWGGFSGNRASAGPSGGGASAMTQRDAT